MATERPKVKFDDNGEIIVTTHGAIPNSGLGPNDITPQIVEVCRRWQRLVECSRGSCLAWHVKG